MALALSKAGADVILVQRNDTNTATKDLLEKEGGGKADIVVCDLSSKEDVGKLIGKVTGDMGRVLDIVVNCGMSPIAIVLKVVLTDRRYSTTTPC